MRVRDTAQLDRGSVRNHLGVLRTHPHQSAHAMTSAAQASTDLAFPTGRFQRPARLDPEDRAKAIETVAATPIQLREAVRGITEEQIETPYRPGGWTVRQVVHHVPDSHLNAYCRFKLALT